MHSPVCCVSSFLLALVKRGAGKTKWRLGRPFKVCLLLADEAEDMDDDAKEADTATDASHPASSDTKQEPGRSEKQVHSRNASGTQDTGQEVTMKSVKVKKRKAVLDDSDDD